MSNSEVSESVQNYSNILWGILEMHVISILFNVWFNLGFLFGMFG